MFLIDKFSSSTCCYAYTGPKEKLNWCIRFKIAVGAAEGLSYLHEGCQRRIIHKDIKASNILLTEEFDAQVHLEREQFRCKCSKTKQQLCIYSSMFF